MVYEMACFFKRISVVSLLDGLNNERIVGVGALSYLVIKLYYVFDNYACFSVWCNTH